MQPGNLSVSDSIPFNRNINGSKILQKGNNFIGNIF